jgi:hypothetical protein
MATFGNGVSIHTVTDPIGVSVPVQGRFPLPAIAWGYCVGLENALLTPVGVIPIPSALNPESPYLEPKIGQIWPR